MSDDGETRPARSVYTIPAHRGFADALAQGLLEECLGDPLALSRHLILLPTRRACRALQEAFLRCSGGAALVLPRLRPIGDLDPEDLILSGSEEGLDNETLDLPPPSPVLERQLSLARLIMAGPALRGGATANADQAVRLAGALAHLLDQLETERLDFTGFAGLVPEAYARHWQITLDFLEVVSGAWPKIEAERGTIGPARHRNLVLERQAEAWRARPPAHPVLIAGSTGSIPATADLIEVVADLPEGRVVLPGLDRHLDAATWQAIGADPSHPQYGLARLLDRLGLGPSDVASWPDPAPVGPGLVTERAHFLAMALRPAATTEAWRDDVQALDDTLLDRALDGLERIDCADQAEEAGVVALVMRKALEVPDRTVALVTPDRGLARRVAAELTRWNIAVDDSAGVPLQATAPGAFLRLWAEAMGEGLAPVPLLAALKHPLAAGGMEPGRFRVRVRDLERAVLRGPRPGAGFHGLSAALEGVEDHADLAGWILNLEARCGDFTRLAAGGPVSLESLVEAHARCCEALAATEAESGAAILWAGEAGEALAAFMAEVADAAGVLGTIDGQSYPSLLDGLMAGRVVRPRYGRHPRAHIWGALEARLQRADVVVLGGLNEGTWPAEAAPDPWLSRPMREAIGLPAHERRIGLAAHDFVQALGAPRVVITRAARVEGAPTVPSRWLLRIDALMRASGRADAMTASAARWRALNRGLDRPAQFSPTVAPRPCPPRAARPRRLSVTAVETWMRDPYAIYAERILRLVPLEALDADPGAAERGRLIHHTLERYLETLDGVAPADREAHLLAIGRAIFAPQTSRPGVWAFWWPRFRRIVPWFVAAHAEAARTVERSVAETEGRLWLEAPGGAFCLTAKADRIDLSVDGSLVIVDYKTGGVPSGRAVEAGVAPQLPLEAAIALAGGFAGVPANRPVSALAYWRITGGDPVGEVVAVKGDASAQGAAARRGLERLIAAFDDPATPYLPVPRGEAPLYPGPYDHLARTREWSAWGEGDEG